MIFFGTLSVKAVLQENKRKIHKVYIQDKKHSKDLNFILYLTHIQNIEVEFVDKEVLHTLTSNQNHGGVCVDCDDRVFETITQFSGNGLYCEGISDPFNLGNMIRTAYCANVKNIIVPKFIFGQSQEIIMRSSAGTFERVNFIELEDVNQLKSLNCDIIIANRDEHSLDYRSYTPPGNFILCVGGEKRGLSKAIKEISTQSLEIKYPFDAKIALSAVSSASILLFEMIRNKEN